MLQDFVKKKFTDYSKLVEFSGSSVFYGQIRKSDLPSFILNFFECSLDTRDRTVTKKTFDELLNKAIVFNVNYVIRPKHTLLKFLFGDVETKPVEFIRHRLAYFQFYGYYLNHIEDFITLNSLEVVSRKQIEHIIDDVNTKLLEEINDTSNGDSQRLNLVKLLYYFFVDLTDNNPINIKLPKKILSVFLGDKGFTQIKSKIDAFFSDEIFIQEALELMNPQTKKTGKTKSDIGLSEKQVKEIVNKAKTTLISKESSNEDVAIVLEANETVPDIEKLPDVKILREKETSMPAIESKTLVIDEEIYSNDLLFASEFNTIIPQPEITDTEKKARILEELFCEESYRKRIIKKIFNKSETNFRDSVNKLLELTSWADAIPAIESLFSKNKVDFYSEEAVKFVDIMQGHFTKTTEYSARKQQGT